MDQPKISAHISDAYTCMMLTSIWNKNQTILDQNVIFIRLEVFVRGV